MPHFSKKPYIQKLSTYFEEKVSLRESYLPDAPEICVFDAFHGKGEIWDEIITRHPERTFQIVGVDKVPHDRLTLKGDNLKYLKSFNLQKFDVIDLDAYGCPYPQLEILFERRYTGLVFVTMVQVVGGGISYGMLEKNGFSRDMITQCPTLFNHDGIDILKNYLATQGIQSIIFYYNHNLSTPKIYMTFTMP